MEHISKTSQLVGKETVQFLFLTLMGELTIEASLSQSELPVRPILMVKNWKICNMDAIPGGPI